jgi:hypothetical protein
MHYCICDSELYDEHFNKIEWGSYIHEDIACYTSEHASSSTDVVMGDLQYTIAESLVAWWGNVILACNELERRLSEHQLTAHLYLDCR